MADRNSIDCPRAKTWMTPCIARDGHTALADDHACVGCGAKPRALLADLAKRYPPAADAPRDPKDAADALTRHVAAYIASPGVSDQVSVTYCERCGHSSDWHRLDDAQNVGPCDPEAKFRCLGYDPMQAGPPIRRCDCPDMVRIGAR